MILFFFPWETMREQRQICINTSLLLKISQASCLSDNGSLGPISDLRSQIHYLLAGRWIVSAEGGQNVDIQLLPLYGSFWGKSSPHSGFRTESRGLFCTGLFHPELCVTRWHQSLHPGEEPARFHTWKSINDFTVCYKIGEIVTHQ